MTEDPYPHSCGRLGGWVDELGRSDGVRGNDNVEEVRLIWRGMVVDGLKVYRKSRAATVYVAMVEVGRPGKKK